MRKIGKIKDGNFVTYANMSNDGSTQEITGAAISIISSL